MNNTTNYKGIVVKHNLEGIIPVGKPITQKDTKTYAGFSRFDEVTDPLLTVYMTYNPGTKLVTIKRNKLTHNSILKKQYQYQPLFFGINEDLVVGETPITKVYITCGVKLSQKHRQELSDRGYFNLFDLLKDEETGHYPKFKEQKDFLFKALNYKLEDVLVIAKYTRFQNVNSTMQDSVQQIMHMVLQRGCQCSVWMPERKQYRVFKPICDIRKVALFKTMQGEKQYKNYPVMAKDKLEALQHARKQWLKERYWSVLNNDTNYLQFKAINTVDYVDDYVVDTINDAEVMECPDCGMPYHPTEGCEHCGYVIPTEAEFIEQARTIYNEYGTDSNAWKNLVVYYEKSLELTISLDKLLGWKA